eukprot:TRINITY_DN8029_c1_g1_i1.p1 TRINITY_DN8029_c1_g1~~TRINITY_DN8029_c1_g1_i1.p1  ORF type:complete len:241 (+),score=85.65 TRINITY_DN8029_c1_g1_i1:72-794(+)
MYSPKTVKRALELFKPKKETQSLREVATLTSVSSAETIRQWLKKDMSQKAIKTRLSKRGRKRKVNQQLLEEMRRFIEHHQQNNIPYTQGDVIKHVKDYTNGVVILSNVDVTRYTQRLGLNRSNKKRSKRKTKKNTKYFNSTNMNNTLENKISQPIDHVAQEEQEVPEVEMKMEIEEEQQQQKNRTLPSVFEEMVRIANEELINQQMMEAQQLQQQQQQQNKLPQIDINEQEMLSNFIQKN